MPEKVISLCIFDPKNSIFKQKASKKARTEVIFCSNSENCDLYKAGSCLYGGIFTHHCEYGRREIEHGYTKKARAYSKWISDRKEKYDPDGKVGRLSSPINKLAVIGDYIYLPYAQMNMNEAVPFDVHSNIFISGTKLISKSDFNVNTIKSIVEFRPMALMSGPHGREILSYQKEEVPLFLAHLNELFPELYEELFETYPELKEKYKPKRISYIGRKAYLLTLSSGFSFSTNHKKYPVKWYWDGTMLTSKSEHAYDKTWGGIKEFDEVSIELKPNKDTVIEVQDNSWVLPTTKFKD